MQRTLIKNSPNLIGEKIKICGFVYSRRDHGGVVFLDVKDRSGVLQVVCVPDLVTDVKDEYVVEIEGEIKKIPPKMSNSANRNR